MYISDFFAIMISRGEVMAAKTNSVDMVNGPLWGKILKFAVLHMMTAVVQHLYSAADVVVVGRFAGEEALAGVGTCSILVKMFLNFVLGLSAGTTIVLGQALGAGDKDKISKASHTAIATAISGGAIAMFICLFFTKRLLDLVSVPENVISQASVYLRVMAIGFIPSLIYNFGAAMLRAKGDTKRALYIVTISGLINVGLNLFFVCVLKMKADGVAAATVISQIFTAVAILKILCTEPDEMRISMKKIRFYKEPFLKILRFGLPSGIQSSVYSASNVIVQSSVNSFGSAATAGSAAVTSITEFYNVMVNSFYQASIVFCSQNYGARKFDRIKKTIGICMVYVAATWAIQSAVTFFLGKTLLGLYTNEAEVFAWGWRKLSLLGYTYGFLGIMNVMSGALRGMGASIFNLITSVVGVCGIRIVWLLTVFPKYRSFETLFTCFPLSWAGTFILHFIMFMFIFNRAKHQQC